MFIQQHILHIGNFFIKRTAIGKFQQPGKFLWQELAYAAFFFSVINLIAEGDYLQNLVIHFNILTNSHLSHNEVASGAMNFVAWPCAQCEKVFAPKHCLKAVREFLQITRIEQGEVAAQRNGHSRELARRLGNVDGEAVT